MKKLIFLLFIPLVFACSSDAVKRLEDKKKNDLDELKLNGKVKSLKATTYSALDKFGEPVKDKFKSEHKRYFNKDGFTTEFNHYDKDGEFKYGWKYKYDDGNMVEENWYYEDLKKYVKTTFKYDDKGNKIESNEYNKDGELEYNWKYKYDDNGNLIELNMYIKDGELFSKSLLKYDDDGNQIELNDYNKDGELENNWKYKYDDDGNMIEKIFYDKNLKEDTKYTFKYDDNGNMIERGIYYEIQFPLKITVSKYKYDDKGNRIEWESYNESGELENEGKYKYDDYGNLIHSSQRRNYRTFAGEWVNKIYVLEYDSKGNAIKSISYEDDKPYQIKEREIEYYD